MSTHLTEAGAKAIAEAAFQRAEIALFDRERQVTEWQPYDVETNPGVTSPERLTCPTIRLRTADGTWVQWAMETLVLEGDTVSPPPPSSWVVVVAT